MIRMMIVNAEWSKSFVSNSTLRLCMTSWTRASSPDPKNKTVSCLKLLHMGCLVGTRVQEMGVPYYYNEALQIGNIFCNHMLAVSLFTYSEVLCCVGFIPTLFTALQTSPPARGRNLFSVTLVPQIFHSVSIAFAVHARGWDAARTGF